MIIDQKFMLRCIELAEMGLGHTAPNPLVGCVIIHKEKIIGEGFHQQFGEAHAEVNAINSIKNKELLNNSTLYVTLEPCSHFGKTPPCADLIVKSGIPRVVIASQDPFPKVAGKGIEILKNAGVNVQTGVLKKEYEFVNRRFFTFFKKQRPYIILKWAQTKDGFIDVERTDDSSKITWITNETCRTLVHKWRSEEQAILIGSNTAINDNPELTVRSWTGKNPLRIVIDKNNCLPKNLKVFNDKAPTIIISEKFNEKNSEKNIETLVISFNDNLVEGILNELYNRNIQSVIIEGGAQTLNSFICKNLWDEARVFTGDITFDKGLSAPIINKEPFSSEMILDSKLEIFKNIK
jgi:diaminohydroxyphosphoribosylaminopyrimidine deaminase/5-amino-6-(5-phosphoribosylamino)uracil reductase